MQSGAFHAGHEFDHPSIADIRDETVNDLITQVAVSHLATLESKRCLHLVAFVEKADGLVLLRLVVVFVDGDGELDLFDGDDLLLLAGSTIALVLLVEKGGMTPSCSPFSSMTRTSRARIRSLVRMKDLAERLSIGGIGRLHSRPPGLPCVSV